MLAIELELLTGRYVATAYNSRREGEWPPHPARLFSALVATHFAVEDPPAEERAVLEWVEGLGAPSIQATEASRREVVTVFVPVNDAGMTDVDAEAEALDEALGALDAARREGASAVVKRAERELAKAEKKLASAIERNVSVPKGRANPDAALRVLPEHRVRQPRTFPSVTPVQPRVTYLWPDAAASEEQRATLRALLERVVRLGHSSSFVAARLRDEVADSEEGGSTWRPSSGGETILRGIQPGQLRALERAHALHRETEPRVMPARFDAYTRRPAEEESRMPGSSFSDDWLVLRRVGGRGVPMVATASVARTLRRALMSYGGEPVPELLSGHGPDRKPSERDHLAIVPLPFVGHRQRGAALHSASGSILGVALVLPRETGEDERRALFRRLARWEAESRIEDEDTPRLMLKLGPAGVLELERVEGGALPATLRSGTWCRAARVWLSVTPVALDRNPGDLRSRDPEKLAAAIAEAQQTLRRACRRIALPDPAEVEVLPSAPLAGAAKARRYPAFPEGQDKAQRVLTHARVEFAEPVRGPILLGAGRYLGLGLFRPESNDA